MPVHRASAPPITPPPAPCLYTPSTSSSIAAPSPSPFKLPLPSTSASTPFQHPTSPGSAPATAATVAAPAGAHPILEGPWGGASTSYARAGPHSSPRNALTGLDRGPTNTASPHGPHSAVNGPCSAPSGSHITAHGNHLALNGPCSAPSGSHAAANDPHVAWHTPSAQGAVQQIGPSSAPNGPSNAPSSSHGVANSLHTAPNSLHTALNGPSSAPAGLSNAPGTSHSVAIDPCSAPNGSHVAPNSPFVTPHTRTHTQATVPPAHTQSTTAFVQGPPLTQPPSVSPAHFSPTLPPQALPPLVCQQRFPLVSASPSKLKSEHTLVIIAVPYFQSKGLIQSPIPLYIILSSTIHTPTRSLSIFAGQWALHRAGCGERTFAGEQLQCCK